MTLLLPERTRGAIVAQAGKMGLTKVRLWQPDEDRVLREIYPEGGVPGVRERLPHRTIPAIKHRVTFLELRSAKRKKQLIPFGMRLYVSLTVLSGSQTRIIGW